MRQAEFYWEKCKENRALSQMVCFCEKTKSHSPKFGEWLFEMKKNCFFILLEPLLCAEQ